MGRKFSEMKKTAIIISAVLLALCLVLTACEKSEGNGSAGSSAENIPVLSLVCENKKVEAGQTARVYLHIEGCERFAVGSFTFTLEGNASLEGGEKADEVDIFAQANTDVENELTAGMFVATTLDLPDTDLYYVDIAVPEDADSGDKIKVTVTVNEFETGVDAGGSELNEISSEIDGCYITLRVA